MNATLGSMGVLLGLAGGIAGIVALVVGLVTGRTAVLRTGTVYVWMVLAGAVIAFLAMERALLTHDFSLRYVAENGSRSTPTMYTAASLWSRLEGSILLWALVLAGYGAAMAWRFRDRRNDPIVAWATLAVLAVSVFFFALLVGPANPFGQVSPVPADGPGPNPLLQNHPLMLIHPPLLYLGYVGFTVPFAFAVAALVTGRLGEGWLIETRRWTLFAWGCLTTGIALGAWWSYEVLGWGGFWAWDPVENASLLPWLTATAYLHSVMVQERRGMLRVWNLSLLCATFALTILGTFLTRSGVLDSVHAFSSGSVGGWTLGFFGLIVVVVVGLIGWRGDRLRSPGTIDSPVSREGAFLVNNLLFAAFAFVVLLGTVFPLVTEALQDDRITVGRPYFDRMAAPIAVCLLFLMAVAPVLPWRKASAETLRDRMQWPLTFAVAVAVVLVALGFRGWLALLAFFLGGLGGGSAVRQLILATRRNGWRGLVGRTNGGMVVHLGVVLIAVAFAASAAYASRAEVTLEVGESAEVGGHRVTYLGSETRRFAATNPKVGVTRARVQVDGGRVFAPAITQYRFQAQGIGTPSVRTGLVDDVYTTLVEAPAEPGGPATIGVLIHPLTTWLWIGAGLMALGTALAAVRVGRSTPPSARRSSPPPARRPAPRTRPGGPKREIDRVPVGARDRKATP